MKTSERIAICIVAVLVGGGLGFGIGRATRPPVPPEETPALTASPRPFHTQEDINAFVFGELANQAIVNAAQTQINTTVVRARAEQARIGDHQSLLIEAFGRRIAAIDAALSGISEEDWRCLSDHGVPGCSYVPTSRTAQFEADLAEDKNRAPKRKDEDR